jgi:hypothetical protein
MYLKTQKKDQETLGSTLLENSEQKYLRDFCQYIYVRRTHKKLSERL